MNLSTEQLQLVGHLLLDYCLHCSAAPGASRADHEHPPASVLLGPRDILANYTCPSCGAKWCCNWWPCLIAGLDPSIDAVLARCPEVA